nr:two-component system regulatory protein YycI [Mammaliicoccus sp. Marseille-Q6498]
MDWKHAKSLFIIVFVLINIGLVIVYFNKVNNSIVQESNAQSDVNFSKEGIDIPTLPDYKDKEMQSITANSKSFSDSDIDGVFSLSEKDTQINKDVNEDIGKDSKQQNFKAFVNKEAYKGKDYQIKKNNSDKNSVVFEQNYDGLPILNNNKGQIVINMQDGKAKKFTQTYLDKLKPGNGDNNSKRKIVDAKTALETLYYNTYLVKGDKVESVRLGYYSVVKEIGGQVLAPTWEVKIKTKEDGKPKTVVMYIDAIKPESTVLEES